MENNDIIENKMPYVAEVVSKAFKEAGIEGVEFYKHSNEKFTTEGRYGVQSLGIKINGACYLLPINNKLRENILNFDDNNKNEISNLIVSDIANRFALSLKHALIKEAHSSNDLSNKIENEADRQEIERARIINSNDNYNLRTLQGIYKNINNSRIEIKDENKKKVQDCEQYNKKERKRRILKNQNILENQKKKSIQYTVPTAIQEQKATTLDDIQEKELSKIKKIIRAQRLRRQQKLRRRQELRRQQQEKLNKAIEQIKKVKKIKKTRGQQGMVSKKTLKTLKLIKNLERRFVNQKKLMIRLRGILRRRGLLDIYNRLDNCHGEFSQRTHATRDIISK